jgi:hypothetical protein
VSGKERLRRRLRRSGRAQPAPGVESVDERAQGAERASQLAATPLDSARIAARTDTPGHRPTPQDLAGLTGAFALTAAVHDPEPTEAPAEETSTERGLRGLVGSGSSQVSVAAALRARDASRPGDDEIAAAESQLVIVRRGWVPRDDLPRPVRR